MKPYYQDSAVTIYHGDCREVLPELEPVDLVLTDPPYGINADLAHRKAAESRIKANGKSKAGRGWVLYHRTEWDLQRPDPEIFILITIKSSNQIIWGGNYFTDVLRPSMGWLVWDKGQRDFSLADGELAWTSYNKALRIKTVSRASALMDNKQHPTQKSLEVMKWCISYAERNDDRLINTVLDPFMGSGTTLRAAKDLNRKAIGIEIEEKYCEIAASRMSQEVLPL